MKIFRADDVTRIDTILCGFCERKWNLDNRHLTVAPVVPSYLKYKRKRKSFHQIQQRTANVFIAYCVVTDCVCRRNSKSKKKRGWLDSRISIPIQAKSQWTSSHHTIATLWRKLIALHCNIKQCTRRHPPVKPFGILNCLSYREMLRSLVQKSLSFWPIHTRKL